MGGDERELLLNNNPTSFLSHLRITVTVDPVELHVQRIHRLVGARLGNQLRSIARRDQQNGRSLVTVTGRWG